MPKGIVRKIDHLGRITIPIEMRDALGIMQRTSWVCI
jgi:bifunctional DNA-binding transcriptional regulator/antitoxin component of YhaV-PrlF toxin-antitoxin module